MNKPEDRILDHRGLFQGQKPESMEGGLRELTRQYKETSKRVSEDIDETIEAAATAQAAAEAKPDARLGGKNKGSTGTAFSQLTWTDLPDGSGGFIEQVITTRGGKVRVSASVKLKNPSSGVAARQWELRITEDGTPGTVESGITTASSGSQFSEISIEETFEPVAGAHTYRLQGQVSSTSNPPNIDQASVSAVEVKENA